MINIIEIKTPNCSHCKAIEPNLILLKNKLNNEHPDKFTFIEYTFGIDNEAKCYMNKYNLRSAPSFIVEGDSIEGKLVKFEELEEYLNSL